MLPNAAVFDEIIPSQVMNYYIKRLRLHTVKTNVSSILVLECCIKKNSHLRFFFLSHKMYLYKNP